MKPTAICPECKAKYYRGETVILNEKREACCQECYRDWDKFVVLKYK